MIRVSKRLVKGILKLFWPFTRRFAHLLNYTERAILVGTSLNIKQWSPLTTRWEMIVLPREVRFYPYSPDRKIVKEVAQLARFVEEELGPYKIAPEVHYVDEESAHDLLRGGDAVALYRPPCKKKDPIAWVVLHPQLGLKRYAQRRKAHLLHELIELSLMQARTNCKEAPKDFHGSQHATVKKYEHIIGKKHHLPVLIYTASKNTKLTKKQKREIEKLKNKPLPRTFEEQDRFYAKYYKILGIKKEIKCL